MTVLVRELCKLLGIVKTRTTPYHPQSDGLVERFNRTLLSMLSTVTRDNERDGELQLPFVMMAYRTSIQESTRTTPFSLMFGREARLPIDLMFGPPPDEVVTSPNEYALDLRSRLEKAYHKVRSHLGLSQQRQKLLYDRRVVGAPYEENDLVWLHCPAVPGERSRKLHRPWHGPYKVVKAISDVVYRIQHLDPPRRRLVVHVDRLKPYRGPRRLSTSSKRVEPTNPQVPDDPFDDPMVTLPPSTLDADSNRQTVRW